jgi:hypothetical protein
MPKFRLVAATLLASASLLTLGSTAAFASSTPNPDPHPTPCVTHTDDNSDFGSYGNDCRTPNPCPTTHIVTPYTVPTGYPTDHPTGYPTDDPTYGPNGLPTGRPTITPNFGVPPTNCPTPAPVRVRDRERPEQFNVLEGSGGTNWADAIGPVAGVGTDTQVSNTDDTLNLGAGRVRTLHTGIPFPAIDLASCIATVTQHGLWTFNGGTGADLNAIGNGNFNLAGVWVFPRLRGVCELSLIRGNPLLQNRVAPVAWAVYVHGEGMARA